MKAASASRLASARFSQRISSRLSGTGTPPGAGPPLHQAANLGRRGKLSPVSFGQRLTGFLDLPLVDLHVFADRFCRHKRAAAALRLRQTVQPFPQLGFQADGHYRGGRHDALLTQPNTRDSTMSKSKQVSHPEGEAGSADHRFCGPRLFASENAPPTRAREFYRLHTQRKAADRNPGGLRCSAGREETIAAKSDTPHLKR